MYMRVPRSVSRAPHGAIATIHHPNREPTTGTLTGARSHIQCFLNHLLQEEIGQLTAEDGQFVAGVDVVRIETNRHAARAPLLLLRGGLVNKPFKFS